MKNLEQKLKELTDKKEAYDMECLRVEIANEIWGIK